MLTGQFDETRLKHMLESYKEFVSKLPDGSSFAKITSFVTELMRDAGNYPTYHFLARKFVSEIDSTLEPSGTDFQAFSHCLLLKTAWKYFESEKYVPMPSSISQRLVTELNRVLDAIERQQANYNLSSDIFVKDLMCFTGRLVPCGMYVVDLFGGFPRSDLLKSPPRTLPSNLWFFMRAGGFRRYAQVHVHEPTLGEFSEHGRDQCFRMLAELLAKDENLLGVMGSSWYYDPAVAEISPHLAYLSRDPAKNGARLFPLGATESAMADPFVRSTRRRTAFESGHYIPTQYAMIWPKKPLFRWLESR